MDRCPHTLPQFQHQHHHQRDSEKQQTTIEIKTMQTTMQITTLKRYKTRDYNIKTIQITRLQQTKQKTTTIGKLQHLKQ
jgi:hypothetical protein